MLLCYGLALGEQYCNTVMCCDWKLNSLATAFKPILKILWLSDHIKSASWSFGAVHTISGKNCIWWERRKGLHRKNEDVLCRTGITANRVDLSPHVREVHKASFWVDVINAHLHEVLPNMHHFNHRFSYVDFRSLLLSSHVLECTHSVYKELIFIVVLGQSNILAQTKDAARLSIEYGSPSVQLIRQHP